MESFGYYPYSGWKQWRLTSMDHLKEQGVIARFLELVRPRLLWVLGC